jgi:hypothetical protein
MDDITVVVGGRRTGKTEYLRKLYNEKSIVVVPYKSQLHSWRGCNAVAYDKDAYVHGYTVLIDDIDMFGHYTDVVEHYSRYNKVIFTVTPKIVYLDTPPTWYGYWTKHPVVKLDANWDTAREYLHSVNAIQYMTSILGEIIVQRKAPTQN